MNDYREPADKVQENRVRRHAARLGYTLHRSRAKRLHSNNRGLYRLVDKRNILALGADFDATLHGVEGYLVDAEARLRGTDPGYQIDWRGGGR